MMERDYNSQPIEKFLYDLTNEKPRSFSHEELKSFTSNWKKKIGFGGFGDVYKGKFSNGVKIAVKVLKDNTNDIMRMQFMSEVSTMGRTSHPNLIKLYGFCFDTNMKALVYEYMKNGSLDTHLFKDLIKIEWVKLYDIAIEIANGLSYLHEHCRPRIIHYDIKAGNVLLDLNLSPKIIDFGMARHSNKDTSLVEQSGYRGTHGFAAPEVGMGRPVTHKSDIYSFGMMLFEILRRKRNSVGPGWFPGDVAEKVENDQLNQITMECGIGEKDKANAEKLCKVALWCTQLKHQNRPDMSSVVKMLHGEIQLQKPPNPFPFYDSSPESSMIGGFARALPKFSPTFSEVLYEEKNQEREAITTNKDFGSGSTLKPPLLKSTPVESHVLERTPVYMKVPSPPPNLRSSGQAISSNEKAPTKKFKTLTLSEKLTRRREVEEILKSFARKFPRGEDENTVIIYTTSNSGRTIHYECEQVRSILQLHRVKIDERMFAHHMYQLREALGKEQFPAVFVKGRFIGGAAELMKLEEEGKLEILLDGIQKLHN